MASSSSCRPSRTFVVHATDRRRAGLFQPPARPWPATYRPHNHQPAGYPHSRPIAPRSHLCRDRPRTHRLPPVAMVRPTDGRRPHEPRTGRFWYGPFQDRGPASASHRRRTKAPHEWFAAGARRAPSATKLSASPSPPRSSGRDGRRDQPGSAPAGTASRTKRTSRPPHGSPERSRPCCSRSAAATPSPVPRRLHSPGRHIWGGSCGAPAGSPE